MPTRWGCLLLVSVTGMLVVSWWFGAEAFLSPNEPLPAEVLVLEAWTGPDGAAAAAAEFKQPNNSYEYIVAAGGLAGEFWAKRRWSYSEVAARDLRRSGVPEDHIVEAQADDVASQRTYETAVAARHALEAKGIRPRAVNILTLGAHARRSRLVFAKVFGPETRVGVISWAPTGYYGPQWWHSSLRADTLIKETVGYLYELLLDSGRSSHAESNQHKPSTQTAQ